jgi:BirA family biotin operon repressor/biotin-[acetyl-CoA-carboxylase] ligase
MTGRWPPGWIVEAHERVGSTNDVARARAREGAPDRTIVWAREQEAGRGRRGRGWASPAGNLYCSAVLRPPVPGARVGELTFLVATAMADAVSRFGVEPAVKWPNDVLVGGAKLAGILLEAEHDAGTATVVAGTGVNVAHHPEPEAYPVTSLIAAGAHDATVEGLLSAYLESLGEWLDRWAARGFAPVRRAWLARAAGLGAPIRVRLPREEIAGVFGGLDDDGTLLLTLPGGAVRPVRSGEVFFSERS